ncbi:hypothetical protein FKM82_004696 [Ascaphus truei]
MMRYTSGSTVTSLTTSETGDAKKTGNICRLRLTLPAQGTSRPEHREIKNEKTETVDVKNTPERRKKNGLVSSDGNTSEPPTLHLYTVPKANSAAGTPSHGVVYGVVQRAENNNQNEVVVYEWSTHQLKEEMNYIKDVRVTLEKIRERMFGEYDEMKQKIKHLTQEMKVSSMQQEVIQSHSQAQAAALGSLDSINSNLNASSIEMQKSLVDMTLENCNIRDEVKNLKHSYEESLDELKEKQKLLEAAQAENQLLKVKVESSQEANADIMREMTRKLYNQYEEKLQQEQLKYAAEKEALMGKTKQYLKAIDDASEKVRIAETKIDERDVKIAELDRLLQRMEQEREQLQAQLSRHEQQIRNIDAKLQINSTDKERCLHLEESAGNLRERIKHLDDMVHCQQKKVKHMIEEIELLKKKVHYKDLLIQQLLERIALLEGENTELQDKMDYLIANQPRNNVETKDVAVSCELPRSHFLCPVGAATGSPFKRMHLGEQGVPGSEINAVPLRSVLETPTCQSSSDSTNDCTSSTSTSSSTETDARSPVQRSYTPYLRVLQLSMKNKVS